jgi:hypothetical protein
MRRDANVVRLGHIGDPSSFRNTTCVRNVGLDDVDAAGFKVWSNVLTGEKSFSELASEVSASLLWFQGSA